MTKKIHKKSRCATKNQFLLLFLQEISYFRGRGRVPASKCAFPFNRGLACRRSFGFGLAPLHQRSTSLDPDPINAHYYKFPRFFDETRPCRDLQFFRRATKSFREVLFPDDVCSFNFTDDWRSESSSWWLEVLTCSGRQNRTWVCSLTCPSPYFLIELFGFRLLCNKQIRPITFANNPNNMLTSRPSLTHLQSRPEFLPRKPH